MLRHIQLVDPIARTKDMDITEFTKYTEITEHQHGPTDSHLIKQIHDQLYEYHSGSTDDKSLAEIWGFISQKLEKNAGLATFILDYDGAKSEFFFPWLVNVFRSPATALEMSYGAGNDMAGNWVERVPTSDPIDFFVRNDPTFVYNRERQLFVADLATTIQERSHDNTNPTKIVDFGAGRLAWARWHNFDFWPDSQDIFAYDKDTSIDPSGLFKSQTLEELHIKYRHGDLMAHVNNPECMNADLILLGGVVSYIPPEIFSQAVLMPIYHLLRSNGVFFFDLQVDCPYLRRSMSIFEWPKMHLPESVSKAIDRIEKVRQDFWRKGMKFSVEYAADTYNEFPSAVMITLQRV